MLKGYHLSRVQFYALSVLELLDRLKEIDNLDRNIRIALVTAHLADLEAAFPELTTEKDDVEELPDEVDAQGNPIAVRYDFSNATYDPKAVEEEMREMLARASVQEDTFEVPQYGEWL